ncbi:MAG: DUF4810 domain-containing protein [Planctomycetota bacterium]
MEAHRRPVNAALVALALVPLTACSSPRSLYRWGAYEDSVHELTANPDAVDVGRELERMLEVVRASRDYGSPVPPGVHAHVGYLYSLQGDLDSARAAFLSEKELYPESTAFVDGVLARMGAQPKAEGGQP